MNSNYEKAYVHIDYIKATIIYFFPTYNLNQEDVEDLAHDIILKIAHGLNTFEEKSSIKTWIGTITRNHVLSFLRKERKVKTVDFDSEMINIDSGYKSTASLNEYNASPENLFLGKEMMDSVHSKIVALPENQKKALYFYADDYSYSEIASMMETSELAVKSLLFRARTKLKKITAETA